MNVSDQHDPRTDHGGDEPAQADAAAGQPQQADLAHKLQDAEDRLLRTQAELENFRKRSRREYEDAMRYREIDLLRDLLPVLDNVRRAIEASEKTADVESLRAGFRMTAQQIEKVIDGHGCKTIETEGRPFDPTIHDALLQQVVPGVAPGTIVGVASHGYRLHDRVVRPAQVIVAQAATG